MLYEAVGSHGIHDMLHVVAVCCVAELCHVRAMLIALSTCSHSITEWFGSEGNFKAHCVQSPCHGQKYLSLDQVAQSPIQPELEYFQGWGIYHLSGQPVPVPHHPHCKKFLRIIEWFGLEGTLEII